MKEQLFIIKDGERHELDLNNPSGISLNYKSNLFGDLSKITCSHTYTFKLPMTLNNRTILDNAEDMRYSSGMIRKRLKAEFYQNGINLFRNANLYISAVSKYTYDSILTWDVVDGLQDMKDEDISLNELPNSNETATFGGSTVKSAEEAFDNMALTLNPTYDCGLPYFNYDFEFYGRGRQPSSYGYYGAYPMPVMPVQKLVSIINEHFNSSFKIGENVPIGSYVYDSSNELNIINNGVIPLVDIKLNDVQLAQREIIIKPPTICYNINKSTFGTTIVSLWCFPDIINKKTDNEFFSVGNAILYEDHYALTGDTYKNAAIIPKMDMMSFDVDGSIKATFHALTSRATVTNPPTLIVYQMQNKPFDASVSSERRVRLHEWKEIATISGEQEGSEDGYRLYYFDFSEINGMPRLECHNLQKDKQIVFAFDYEVKACSVLQDMRLCLVNSNGCKAARPIDAIGNLPDISCLTFIKSLFFMIGAFPMLDGDGNIVPRFYSELKRNIESGKVLDWSDKDNSNPATSPEMKYATSDFCQRNYYIMKSDDLDKKDDDNDEMDVYASGVFSLNVANETLELNKTIIQLPFYAPFIKNKKMPSIPTGNTMKVWTLSNDQPSWERPSAYVRGEWNQPKPCYGIIVNRTPKRTNLSTGETTTQAPLMSMVAWNFRESAPNSPSFSYLQEIISNPYVITIELNLNEFDLRDIDYSVPVYLNKYNSYFAVVSIKRDSKGKCKCELIKLP